jgi:hypothetical protein
MNTRPLRDARSPGDAVGTPPVIVIDETLARQAWPGQSAVGSSLQLGPTGTAQLRGGDRRRRAPAEYDLTRPVRPQIFFSMGQQIPVVLAFAVEAAVVRRRASPMRSAAWCTMDKDLAVTRMAPMAFYLSEDGAGPVQLPAHGGARRHRAAARGGGDLRVIACRQSAHP